MIRTRQPRSDGIPPVKGGVQRADQLDQANADPTSAGAPMEDPGHSSGMSCSPWPSSSTNMSKADPVVQTKASMVRRHAGHVLEEDRKQPLHHRSDFGCEMSDAEPLPKPLLAYPCPPVRFHNKRFEHLPYYPDDHTYTHRKRRHRYVIPRVIPRPGDCPDEFEYRTSGRIAEWATYTQDVQDDFLDELLVRTDPARARLLTAATALGNKKRERCYFPCAYECETFMDGPCVHLQSHCSENGQSVHLPALINTTHQSTAVLHTTAKTTAAGSPNSRGE